MQNDYLEKVYSGFLGMNVGIRLGAPVEPTVWTSERIQHYYGDIRGYVKPFRNFAADDDANGPVFFIRALNDGALHRTLTPDDVAEAWLNYAREGVGMFWWGGYGVSTEHTAYLNLKAGIRAPQSGSAKVNGKIMAEQIGGQIFIDTWGLVFPNNAKKAAEYASAAASVSHDGNGVYGAAFIAACIAQAFSSGDPERLISAGLGVIPSDCTYAAVVNAVLDFYHAHPDDWRSCLDMLQRDWGYDKYRGVCHIIPNAGVCVMSLLYGKDFARTVEIATMSGWDTDCNAGNVGTIMGVAHGVDGIPAHYRTPINDSIVLSGISGYLNILDIPSYAKELAAMGHILAGEQVPESLRTVADGETRFDFELPGSTHNFRLSNDVDFSLCHADGEGVEGGGCLRVLFDRIVRGKKTKIFYKPFYRRADFEDTRYSPVFSPRAYSGQIVKMKLRTERLEGEGLLISPYVRNTLTGKDVLLQGMSFNDSEWREISFTIPAADGAVIDEIGIILESNSSIKNRDLGCLYLDDFSITGKASYCIDMSKQVVEFGSVTPFSHDHGAWELNDGAMDGMTIDYAEAMTGNYFTRDASVTGSVTPHTGESHLLSLRVKGARNGYYAGLCSGGLAICKKQRGVLETLAFKPFDWKHENRYDMVFTARGGELELSVNGEAELRAQDDALEYGMVGYAMHGAGRCTFGNMQITEL